MNTHRNFFELYIGKNIFINRVMLAVFLFMSTHVAYGLTSGNITITNGENNFMFVPAMVSSCIESHGDDNSNPEELITAYDLAKNSGTASVTKYVYADASLFDDCTGAPSLLSYLVVWRNGGAGCVAMLIDSGSVDVRSYGDVGVQMLTPKFADGYSGEGSDWTALGSYTLNSDAGPFEMVLTNTASDKTESTTKNTIASCQQEMQSISDWAGTSSALVSFNIDISLYAVNWLLASYGSLAIYLKTGLEVLACILNCNLDNEDKEGDADVDYKRIKSNNFADVKSAFDNALQGTINKS